MGEKGSLALHVTSVECKNLWHKVAQFHICLAATGSTRRRNGTGSGSRITGGGASGDNLGSPCCWFMHEPCARFAETDGDDVNRGDIRTGRHPLYRGAGGSPSTGMGGGPHKDITYSDVVFIPATCLFEPSVMWNEEHGGDRRDNNPVEQSHHPDALNPHWVRNLRTLNVTVSGVKCSEKLKFS